MYDENPTKPTQPVPQVQYVYVEKPRKRGCGGCLSRAFIVTVVLLACLIFSGSLVVGTMVYANLSEEIEAGVAKLDAARDRETFETTQIFDRDGALLWEIFGEGKRTQVPLEQIPDYVIAATVSVEDDTFYDNIGLDAPSLIAALIANLRNPNDRPVGGSTITQQLVRHIVFDYEERTAVSYDRKAKEVILAWLMNREYSKDEIMTMYLNEIYYGNLAYGIEAASQTYFGKSATGLSFGEATLLAGLPQSPVDLDPIRNLEGAKERQWIVLSLMVSEGYISPEQAEAAYQEPLTFAPQEVSLVAPHFSVYVRQQLEEMFGAEEVANGGLRVTTSLDLDYQRLAEQLARRHVDDVGVEHNLTNASLVALKPQTGEILAMLGSVDYYDDTIDGHVNVALSLQQPGSAIKPLTYAAAISPDEAGQTPWTLADILWDVEVEYPQFDGSRYEPVNYDGRFHGPVRLRSALANSYNIPAVLLLQDVGVPPLLEFARKMGITTWNEDSSNYGLSLTLGGAEVRPLDMAVAYGVFANQGKAVTPVAILRVEKRNGEVLYINESGETAQVIDPRVAYLISDVLDDDAARVPAMGRDNPLALPFPAAAKTGTTNDFRDNWTVGYTPGLVTAVWTGNTDNSEMLNISGLTGAAPLWSDFMQAVYGDYALLAALSVNGMPPVNDFSPPDGLEKVTLCAISSVVVGATECSPAGSEWVLTVNKPVENNEPDRVVWEDIEPGVTRVTAVALPPLPVDVLETMNSEDEDAPPPQLFCHFAEGTDALILPPDALPQVFLDAPHNPESVKAAHEWAQANNLAIMPTEMCNEELLALARDPNRVAVYRITTPKNGDKLTGVLPIIGTADFDPAVVEFYKIELGMPQADGNINWVTLGDTHNTPVVNGQLEVLHADALPEGAYFLRLIVVKDSNYVGEPHTIQFTVSHTE